MQKFLLVSILAIALFFSLNLTYMDESKRTLLFEDNFDTLSLEIANPPIGTDNWISYYEGWRSHHLTGNNDKCYKTFSPHVSSTLHACTGKSTIKLLAMKTSVTDLSKVDNLPYVGAMISGEVSHAQLYGYWEVRAKFNISRSQHWAIWLLQQDGAWPPEIDMVEVVGDGRDPISNVYMTQHGSSSDSMSVISNVTIDQFHTYGFEWTKTDLVWYLDGIEVKRVANYLAKPMYILVSPEIANKWSGEPDHTTVWPTVCEIDYIRIYDKK